MTELEPGFEPAGEDQKEARMWATLLHLSLLSGLIVPYGGLIVPVVIYVIKKDDIPSLQPHWNVVLNWMISVLIYSVVCFLLFLIVIGIFMFWALALLSLVFPIIGAIKANDGEVWPYPLSLRIIGNG